MTMYVHVYIYIVRVCVSLNNYSVISIMESEYLQCIG